MVSDVPALSVAGKLISSSRRSRRGGRRRPPWFSTPRMASAARPAAQALGAPADLVDLVDEDDAVLFDRLLGFRDDLVVVEQLVALFGDQQAMAFRNSQLARLRPPAAERLTQHVVEVEHAHLRAGH